MDIVLLYFSFLYACPHSAATSCSFITLIYWYSGYCVHTHQTSILTLATDSVSCTKRWWIPSTQLCICAVVYSCVSMLPSAFSGCAVISAHKMMQQWWSSWTACYTLVSLIGWYLNAHCVLSIECTHWALDVHLQHQSYSLSIGWSGAHPLSYLLWAVPLMAWTLSIKHRIPYRYQPECH